MSETKKVCLIASKGTLDMAYPPLILGSTAAAMDMEVSIFFTFYGLEILKKNKSLQVSPIANPAAPPPFPSVPFGVPNMLGMLPGMTAVATAMMESWMKDANVLSADELIDRCLKLGVKLIACRMTMDVMHIKDEDLIDGIVFGGAATYLNEAADADINLFI